MVVYSGDTNRSAVLYDSLRADSVPFEGVISDGSSIRIDFLAEEPAAATAFNIRFEGAVCPWWDTRAVPGSARTPSPRGQLQTRGCRKGPGCPQHGQSWCSSVAPVVV